LGALQRNGNFVRTVAIGYLTTHELDANVRFVKIDLNIRIYRE
jgi:hypothetical protein